MDLNELNDRLCNSGSADMVVTHPVTGEALKHDGKDVIISLYGKDSDIARKAMKQAAQKALNKRIQRTDIDNAIGNAASLLASCTAGWSGITEGGKVVEFSHEAACELYTKYHWLREQVDEFIGDRANFFKA